MADMRSSSLIQLIYCFPDPKYRMKPNGDVERIRKNAEGVEYITPQLGSNVGGTSGIKYQGNQAFAQLRSTDR